MKGIFFKCRNSFPRTMLLKLATNHEGESDGTLLRINKINGEENEEKQINELVVPTRLCENR